MWEGCWGEACSLCRLTGPPSMGLSYLHAHQCYLFWYDNHKGWKTLSTTTVNRVDSTGWKLLRRFYLAPLRGCVKCQQQNRNWGRTWLVNVKSSTPRKMEALFSYSRGMRHLKLIPLAGQNREKNVKTFCSKLFKNLPELTCNSGKIKLR